MVSDSPCFQCFCLFPPLAASSYDAVQRRVDELRVYVGEARKLALVDVGDDQLIGRGQHRLRAGEELVEVFCSFAALKDGDLKVGQTKCRAVTRRHHLSTKCG